MKKFSFKELISHIASFDNSDYKRFVPLFINEASKGCNWEKWNDDVFLEYFEKPSNCTAYLGQGCLRPTQKDAIKKNWLVLAPHLKSIALSQDIPLWDEYKTIKKVVSQCAGANMQVATNRMLACLQPKLLCTEVDLNKVNRLFDYIIAYTDAIVPTYDRKCWESASHSLLAMFHNACPERDIMDFSFLPWRLLKLFETMQNSGEIQTYWITSWNNDEYELHKHFSVYDKIDWDNTKNNKFKVGDIVYLYSSFPEQRIRYKTEVIKINVTPDEELDKHDCSLSSSPQSNNLAFRLKKIDSIDKEALNYKHLKLEGLNCSIRTPMKLTGQLLVYINSIWEQEEDVYNEIENPDQYFEGALKKVYVNKYERDKYAREECIKANGCKCAACGMNFEETFGELGKGFIHVHHIVPISTIGKEYKINPEKDLVPVCPNCHAMLHRGANGQVLKVEELKLLIKHK